MKLSSVPFPAQQPPAALPTGGDASSPATAARAQAAAVGAPGLPAAAGQRYSAEEKRAPAVQPLQAQQITVTRGVMGTARSEGPGPERAETSVQEAHRRTLQKARDVHAVGMMDARLRDEADAATRSGRLSSKGVAIVEHALTRPAGEEDRRVALVSEGGALQRGTVVMTEHPWVVSRGMLDGGRIVVWEPGQPLREHASYGAFNEFLRLRAGIQAMQPNMSLRAGTPGQLRLEQEWADRAKPVPPHPDLLALTLRPAPPADPREAQLLPALQQPDRPGEGALKAELRTAMNQESALRQGIAAGKGGQALQQLDQWGRRESILEFARARLRPALKDQTGQELDPDRIRIRAEFRSEPIAGEGTIARGTTPHGQRIQPPPVTLSLTEWSLHNTGDLTSRSTRTVTVTDDQGRPIPGLSVNDVVAVIQKVDIGKTYPAQLKDRLLHSDAGKALRTQHRDLMLAGMRSDASAAQLNGHFLADRNHRGLHWVRAVIDHPEQAGRPPVEGQTITANALYLNDTPIPGVMIIRPQHERSVPSVVVHTPGAPDGIAFKEYENLQAARRDLMIRPGMKEWMVSQVPASAQQGVRRELDAGRAQPGRLPVLQPIQGNVADYLYERKVESAIVEVSRTTVSNDDRRNDTLADGIGTGITLLKTLMGFVPFAGTLISVTEGAMHLAEGLDHRQKGNTEAARTSFMQASLSAIQAGASLFGDAALPGGPVKAGSRPLSPGTRPAPGTAASATPAPPAPVTLPKKKGPPIVRLPDGRIGIPLSPIKPPRWSGRPGTAPGNAAAGGAPGTPTPPILQGSRPPASAPGRADAAPRPSSLAAGKRPLPASDKQAPAPKKALAHDPGTGNTATEGHPVAAGVRPSGLAADPELSALMNRTDALSNKGVAFRENYLAKLKEYESGNAGAVKKIVQDISEGGRNPLFKRKHEAALKYATDVTPPPDGTLIVPPAAVQTPPRTHATPEPVAVRGSGNVQAPVVPAASTRMELTPQQRAELSQKKLYHYTDRKSLAAIRAENMIRFGNRDPAGTPSPAYSRTIYFTDISPTDMKNNPTLIDKLFGKSRTGQTRHNKVETAVEIKLENLPPGTAVYKESDGIYTIDRKGHKSEMGIPLGNSLLKKDERWAILPRSSRAMAPDAGTSVWARIRSAAGDRPPVLGEQTHFGRAASIARFLRGTLAAFRGP